MFICENISLSTQHEGIMKKSWTKQKARLCAYFLRVLVTEIYIDGGPGLNIFLIVP